jgi:hypothetical protein
MPLKSAYLFLKNCFFVSFFSFALFWFLHAVYLNIDCMPHLYPSHIKSFTFLGIFFVFGAAIHSSFNRCLSSLPRHESPEWGGGGGMTDSACGPLYFLLSTGDIIQQMIPQTYYPITCFYSSFPPICKGGDVEY